MLIKFAFFECFAYIWVHPGPIYAPFWRAFTGHQTFIIMYNEPEVYTGRPAIIEAIRNEARGIIAPKKPVKKLTRWQLENPKPDETGREPEFIIKTAGRWLRDAVKKADPKMLFDSFWLQHELCILFADTNSGKSVLAVQIADSISKGKSIDGLQMTAPATGVLYFDYELSDKQFHLRYSAEGHNYQFHKRFSRAITNGGANKMYKFNSYQEYIENELENSLLIAKAKVLIIDNISCLKYNTVAATGAYTLVRSLQTIKAKYNISILVLAHTPKCNPLKPITKNDLQGSKILLNFCDSAFAIGESQTTTGLRYLKQIKQRSATQHYGPENVLLGHLEKPADFLQFKFNGHAAEQQHLQANREQYRIQLEADVNKLAQQGYSVRQIAEQLNVSASSVGRMRKRVDEIKLIQ